MFLRSQRGAHRGGFSQPVAVIETAGKGGHHSFHQVGAGGGGAVEQQPQRSEAFGVEAGRIQDSLQLGGHHDGGGDPLFGYCRHRPLGIEGGKHNVGLPVHQHGDHPQSGGGVIEGGGGQIDIGGAKLLGNGGDVSVVSHGGMGEAHALGIPGCPARIDDEGGVLRQGAQGGRLGGGEQSAELGAVVFDQRRPVR